MTVVGVLALDHVIGFELMIAGQVFGMANLAEAEDGPSHLEPGRIAVTNSVVPQRYEIRVCTMGRPITTVVEWGATEVRTSFGPDALSVADIVIVPGTQDFLEDPDPGVIDVLRDAGARGARIAAVCVGAFTLAAAGLLDGLPATTHWQWAGELARRYPLVDVDPAVLFVDTGQILTSAGVTSGLDLCLHLIRQDAGADLAGRTARRLVIPAWRDGGQAQYIEHDDPAGSTHPLHSTIGWMEQNAAASLDLETIADHASMSVRTLNRQFRMYAGTTPLQLLLRMRVDRARRLLETTHLPIDRVAEESGFGSHAALRYHFQKGVGVAPQKYRSNYLTSTRAPDQRAKP